jgi:hypothetical protein
MKVLRCMMEPNTPVPAPPSASSSSSSPTPSFTSNSSSLSSAVALPANESNGRNWIYFKYDRNLYSYKIFHIEIQWFVCDSWLIDDFVTLLYRRCGGFELRCQTPSYFNSDNLNIHPFRPAPYIYLSNPAPTAYHRLPLAPASSSTIILSSSPTSSSSNNNGSDLLPSITGTGLPPLPPSHPAGSGGNSVLVPSSGSALSLTSPSEPQVFTIPIAHSSTLRLIERLYFIF